MQISAKELSDALRPIGTLPKTYVIEHVTIETDTVTGKAKRKTEKSKHAIIEVQYGSQRVCVDFDAFKGAARKLGMLTVEIEMRSGNMLSLRYQDGRGDFTLLHIPVTPGAVLDLSTLEHSHVTA